MSLFFIEFIMADDIEELLDEVESKFIHSENKLAVTQESAPTGKRYI